MSFSIFMNLAQTSLKFMFKFRLLIVVKKTQVKDSKMYFRMIN